MSKKIASKGIANEYRQRNRNSSAFSCDPPQGVGFGLGGIFESRLLENQWSESVSVRIARCVLGLLRDVGFLREVTRGRREIANYRMSDEGAALLARELQEGGVTDSSLCAHPDWGLFGMTESEVLERLDGLGEHRGVIVQRAGSVVHFTWTVNSLEELIDVLTR